MPCKEGGRFLYPENPVLDVWFGKNYTVEKKKGKNSL